METEMDPPGAAPGEEERMVRLRSPLHWPAALIAAVAASALLLQYVLLVGDTLATVGPGLATVRYFSYFTILGNMLVVAVIALTVFTPALRIGRWLSPFVDLTAPDLPAVLRNWAACSRCSWPVVPCWCLSTAGAGASGSR